MCFFFFLIKTIDQRNGWITTCNPPSGEYCTGNQFGEQSQKFLIWCPCSIQLWQRATAQGSFSGRRKVTLWEEDTEVGCTPWSTSNLFPRWNVRLQTSYCPSTVSTVYQTSFFGSEYPHFPRVNHLVLFLLEAGGPVAWAGPSKHHFFGTHWWRAGTAYSTQTHKETKLCPQNRALALLHWTHRWWMQGCSC